MTPETLFDQSADLESRFQSAIAELKRKDERLTLYEEEVSRLHEMIRELKRHRFGKSSERWVSPEQLCFNEAELLARQSAPESEEPSTVEVPAHSREIRGKRKPLPEDLPREVVVIELPESERVSEDGTPLKVIGKEVSEKFVYEPATMKVVEYHRLKYGVDSGDYVKTAPPIPCLIPKGIVTEGLLADIVTKKFGYGLPYYRQEEIFEELGVSIPRCTMARWVIEAAEKLQPILNVLNDRLMDSPYVSCDETWTQVLKEKGRTAESDSWMWVRCTPSEKKKIVLFDYDPHRSGEVARRLFADYRGALQVDGLAVYNVLERQEGVIRLGCNMHGRRKFEQAHKTGSKRGQGLAEAGLRFYKRLYDVEEKARQMSIEERHRLRQEEAQPIWAEFKSWADEHHRKVPPKCKLGEAFRYFLNEYEYLIGYLKDGTYEMDNGFAERAIRKFAIGRNNWLFADSVAGAEASALFYSLLVTIKVNGGDPYKTLKSIFEQVPLVKSIDDYERLADLILSVAPAR